jgi:uncharacterized membrane protein HdeD (DUF308 family)
VVTLAQNRLGKLWQDPVTRRRKYWSVVLALGVAQIVVGALAVSFAFSATLASVMLLGVLLLVCGGIQVAGAIWARDLAGFTLFLLLGIMYVVAGTLILANPLAAEKGLTLLLGVAFLVGGVYRVAVVLFERFPAWGWVLFNGVITTMMGYIICQLWPASGLWVIGLFVGIDLILNGATWSVMAIGIRNKNTPTIDSSVLVL